MTEILEYIPFMIIVSVIPLLKIIKTLKCSLRIRKDNLRLQSYVDLFLKDKQYSQEQIKVSSFFKNYIKDMKINYIVGVSTNLKSSEKKIFYFFSKSNYFLFYYFLSNPDNYQSSAYGLDVYDRCSFSNNKEKESLSFCFIDDKINEMEFSNNLSKIDDLFIKHNDFLLDLLHFLSTENNKFLESNNLFYFDYDDFHKVRKQKEALLLDNKLQSYFKAH